MKTTDRLAIAIVVSMVLGSMTLLELTSDRGFLLLAVPVIALMEVISAVSRRFGITSWLIHLWQVLVLAGIGVGVGLGSMPGSGNWLSQLWNLYLEGLLHIQTSAAPMPTSPGVRWLLLLLVGLITIIADVLVISLATPAWMLAPLLTMYLIPALAIPRPVRWYSFVLLGVAYVIVLAADSLNQLATWTRNLAADNAERSHSGRGVWRMAAVVAAPVLALSLALGTALPALGSLDISSRRPRGNGPIQLQDPTVELNRNLAQQSSRVVLSYTSTNPNGEYMRSTALSKMDKSGWTLVPMDLSQGTNPGRPSGVTQLGSTQTADITIGEFSSQYLPLPYAPTAVTVDGQWGYDPRTLTLVSTAANNGDATRNLKVQATSVGTDPDPEAFTRASAGTPSDGGVTAEVPDDVPKEIIDLAASVTKNAETDVLKAAAIQEFLRNPQEFSYSTEAPQGSGYEVLSNFLLRDKKGYCVHFASAMALMARIEGIPSRVAIGFLPGTKEGNVWSVQGKNMHAWPELYFQGYGWVRFEPTSAVADAPEWTVAQASQPTASPSASQSASPEPSSSDSVLPTGAPTLPDEPTDDGALDGGGFPWRQTLTGFGIVALVVLVALVPMVVRTGLRRRRFGALGDVHDQVAGLWAEVRDTVVDAGDAWPEGTPRERGAALATQLSPESHEALARLAESVERSRYARGLDTVPGGLPDDVTTVTHEIWARQTRGTQLLMRFAPKSLWTNLVARVRG